MAFYDSLEYYGDNVACKADDGSSITYCELGYLSKELGAVMKERELVFEFCGNNIGSIVGYVSFLNRKVVPLMLKADIDGELQENLLDIYKPRYVYLPVEMKNHFVMWECIWERYGYCLLENKKKNNSIELYNELGLLLTTSGSTGSPKLVRQSYTNINSNAYAIAKYLQLSENERPITTLPMNYTYGLSVINSHLLVGATMLLTDYSLMNREFWNFFQESEATSFSGVPYTYEMLKKLRFFMRDLPSLKTMTQAGGKLSPELHEEFAKYAEENGKKFVVMYGQTEATARMAYLPAEFAINKKGSMGIAIPGGKLWLKDSDDNEIQAYNTVGELVYEGENVTLGYAESREDLRKGDERKGRLDTGDMAVKDEDGFFYIVGRKKRFLKIYGNRVNLDEIEGMIKKEYKGIECACAGVDDKLYVFVVAEQQDVHKEISLFLSVKTKLNIQAFEVKNIEQIPKSESGKVLYSKLQEYM